MKKKTNTPKEMDYELAKFMHDEYEMYAKKVGWETQESTKTIFDELPLANREVMLWVAKSVRIKLLQAEIERLERMKRKLPTVDEYCEYCGVNGYECDCAGYNQALQDQISHLQDQIIKIKE